jgi:hypothetical protein
LESPIEETVTSSASPIRAKGGSSAVTITAATFDTRTRVESTTIPSLASRPASERLANRLAGVSPVPCSPTTRP